MLDFSKYPTLAFAREGRVLTIALNRPEKLNAVNGPMHHELSSVFVEAAREKESDVIVLTGTGRAFCAGGDFAWLQEMIEDPDEYLNAGGDAKRIIQSILDCEKPIIAKVKGAATGLGATLALFSDVIFASEGAKFGDPHVTAGFVAGDGGCVIWPQLIGYARAKEYLMTGDMMLAEQAVQMGLINHVVSADQLDAKVSEFAQRLVKSHQRSIRWTKQCVNIGLKQLAASILDASLGYELLTNYTADHQEALNALKERRPPVYTGK
jgi:enoyl-CoA hydratase